MAINLVSTQEKNRVFLALYITILLVNGRLYCRQYWGVLPPCSYVLVLVIGMASTASDYRLFTQFGMTRRTFFQSQLLVHGLVAILSVLSLLVMIGLAGLFATPTEYYFYFSNGDVAYSAVRIFSYLMYSAWCFFLMPLIGAIYALFINRFRSKGRGIILGLTLAIPVCYMAWVDYAMMPNFYYPIMVLLGIFFQPLICLPLGIALVALYWVLIMKHDSQDMFAI
ncbi:hypothetical protein ACVR05_04350 [Streptococcus caprae]|uniref:ABC transporter permease n=1 Tax=Streptococcus caprae TaxID=1640501 RepID=A0ABV8CXR0_9STRE